uniref:Thioredoxin n=1 Tax=Neogobius melanostomus TaxID=47308 RepID=A0A8C6U661_9GOBI
MVKYVLSESELQAELGSAGNKLVVIDFTAKWCPPCKAIAPEFEKLAGQHKDVVFLKVDIDDAKELSAKHGIRSVPTFLFFKGGAKVDTMSGADLNGLKARILKHK